MRSCNPPRCQSGCQSPVGNFRLLKHNMCPIAKGNWMICHRRLAHGPSHKSRPHGFRSKYDYHLGRNRGQILPNCARSNPVDSYSSLQKLPSSRRLRFCLLHKETPSSEARQYIEPLTLPWAEFLMDKGHFPRRSRTHFQQRSLVSPAFRNIHTSYPWIVSHLHRCLWQSWCLGNIHCPRRLRWCRKTCNSSFCCIHPHTIAAFCPCNCPIDCDHSVRPARKLCTALPLPRGKHAPGAGCYAARLQTPPPQPYLQ